MIHATTLESPKDARRTTGLSKTRRMPAAFAVHLRHVGRVYPAARHPEVVRVIDNPAWHRGNPIDEALADNPHLRFERLPAYNPQRNPVERLWRKLRRATHNRLFDTLVDLKSSIRASLSDFPTVRRKVRSMFKGRPKRKASG